MEMLVTARSSANLTFPKMEYHTLVRRLLIRAATARHFLVTDVKVGGRSQLWGAGCVPATLFSERSLHRMDLDVVPAGREVIVSLTNVSDQDQSVLADLVGRPAEPGECLGLRTWEIFLGLGCTLVKPGHHLRLSTQAQCCAALRGLVIPSEVAPAFDVLSVSRGGDLWWLPPGGRSGLEAARFVEDVENQWDCPLVVNPGSVFGSEFVTVTVANKSGEPRWFAGALVGQRLGDEKKI